VQTFLDAFNRGDQAVLTTIFPAKGSHPSEPSQSWYGPDQLRWYSAGIANPARGVDLFNAYDRETLLVYFAERYRQHERVRLVELKINPASGFPGMVAINFRVARQADDLPERIVTGKGGIGCAQGTIFLWSQGDADGGI